MQIFFDLKKRKTLPINVIVGVLIFLSSFVPAQAAQLSGEWKFHPAACFGTALPGSQVQKMMASERYTYMVVRGRLFARNKTTFYIPFKREYNSLYRADRLHPEKGLYPMNDEVKLHQRQVDIAEYSPRAQRLVVVYVDGMIEIVDDADNVVQCRDLKNLSIPLSKSVRSINFDLDNQTAYIALGCGYFTIDLISGALLSFDQTSTQVDYINRVGEKMVATAVASDGVSRLFVFDKGNSLDTDASKAKTLAWSVAHTGNCFDAATLQLVAPQNVMPLTDDTFAVAVPHGANYCVHAVKIADDDTLSAINVFQQPFTASTMGADANYAHLYTLDGLISEYRNGYLFNFNNAVGLLQIGQTFDSSATKPVDDFRARAARLIAKSGLSSMADALSAEAQRKVASWDGHTIDFHHFGEGMYSRNAEYDESAAWNSAVKWGARSATLDPRGNPTAVAGYFEPNPKYGLVVRGNHGTTKLAIDNSQYDNLSSFSNGEWTHHALHITNPEFNTPLASVRGAAADPLNPDHIYSSGYYRGIVRQNLADPSDVLILGRPGDTDANKCPGHIPAFTDLNSSAYVMNPTAPKFDANGVMWSMYDRSIPSGQERRMVLYYWTPEDRMAAENAVTDHSLYEAHPLKKIEIFKNKVSTRDQYLLPLMSEGHTSKLLYYFYDYRDESRCYFIYDHRGTLDDTSDDLFYNLSEMLVAETGKPMLSDSNYYMLGAAEDPASRTVYILTMMGCYYLNLDDLDSPNPRVHEMVLSTELTGIPLQNMNEFTCMTVDLQGRKWFGGSHGLYCVAPDNQTLLGYYTPDNSDLPSEAVVAVGLNPEDGSIMVGTYFGGVTQFFPEGTPGLSAPERHIAVIPSEVHPHYMGHLSFSGLSDDSIYELVDAKGATVAVLGKPENGYMQWNQRSDAGKLVATGVYYLRTGDVNLKEIKVIR